MELTPHRRNIDGKGRHGSGTRLDSATIFDGLDRCDRWHSSAAPSDNAVDEGFRDPVTIGNPHWTGKGTLMNDHGLLKFHLSDRSILRWRPGKLNCENSKMRWGNVEIKDVQKFWPIQHSYHSTCTLYGMQNKWSLGRCCDVSLSFIVEQTRRICI